MWIQTWGEHMHHGYYDKHSSTRDHRQAQTDMIDNAISWAYLNGVHRPDVYRTQSINQLIDVGCGVGGSSRHIARMTGCSGVGVSLSPRQVKYLICRDMHNPSCTDCIG